LPISELDQVFCAWGVAILETAAGELGRDDDDIVEVDSNGGVKYGGIVVVPIANPGTEIVWCAGAERECLSQRDAAVEADASPHVTIIIVAIEKAA